MRLLWYSNAPWNATGYGQQTAIQVPRLQSLGHDVAVMAFHGLQGQAQEWHGIKVYPGSSEETWGQDLMLGHYQHHRADMMMTLMDPWVLDPARLNEFQTAGMKIAHWYPVDCEPLSMLDQRILTMCGTRPVAMSLHGMKMLAEFGPLYVPHSIETGLFAPVSDEFREQSRAKGGFTDLFLIGMNAANQDPVRKGFGEQLMAFRLLADRHPDVRMLIHTRKQTRTGVNFERLVDVLKLQGFVQFGEQYPTATGMTSSQELARWYSICDIMTNCAYGEGFGLPVIEAQSSGTPVVVTDASAMTELCGSGWCVEGEFYWNSGHGAWWTKPSVQAIYAAYEQAYQERGTPEAAARRVAAREFALQYDADLVLKRYWEPVLDELEGFGGTDKHGGLRWLPGAEHDDAVAEAILELVPEGGVFADAFEDNGEIALRVAQKASRVIAPRLEQKQLRENAELNGLSRIVAIQDKLDLSAEPYIDVLRLDADALGNQRDVIRDHKPALIIAHGKGRHGLRERLRGMGYQSSLIAGSDSVKAVRS